MAEPHTPPTSTTYTTNTAIPPHATNTTTTTHIRETGSSTNWFAYLLGGAVIAVGIGALVLSGGDDATVAPPAGSNNVTIEAPATAPAAEAPAAPAPEAPAATTPEPAAPAATPEAAPADPAPAPDAGTAVPPASGG